MYSKSAEYGGRAIIYMAVHQKKDKSIGLLEIAKDQKIPSHFLSKILQILVREKILTSIKGPNGGFQIKRSLDKVILGEVMDAIDGEGKHEKCLLGYPYCSYKTPCPFDAMHVPVVNHMDALLSSNLLQLRTSVLKNNSFIKRQRSRNKKRV